MTTHPSIYLTERDLIFSQKEFERRYQKYYALKKLATVPHYLTGEIEHQNTVNGFTQHIPEPVKVLTPHSQKRNGAIKQES